MDCKMSPNRRPRCLGLSVSKNNTYILLNHQVMFLKLQINPLLPMPFLFIATLQWRHYERGGVSYHRRLDCLLNRLFRCISKKTSKLRVTDCLCNRLFRRRSKKTSKLRVTGLWAGNSPGTGEFPAQMASNAENVFIWWRHHENKLCNSNYIPWRNIHEWYQIVFWGLHESPGPNWRIHWTLGDADVILNWKFSNSYRKIT